MLFVSQCCDFFPSSSMHFADIFGDLKRHCQCCLAESVVISSKSVLFFFLKKNSFKQKSLGSILVNYYLFYLLELLIFLSRWYVLCICTEFLLTNVITRCIVLLRLIHHPLSEGLFF